MEDAVKTTELKPDWAKGWGRKGSALHGMGEPSKLQLLLHIWITTYQHISANAVEAFEQALKLDPTNAQAKSGLAAVKRVIDGESDSKRSASNPAASLNNIFNDPQLIPKMARNPKTSKLLGDSEFMAKLQMVKESPNMMGETMQDPRFIAVLSVLLGIEAEYPSGTSTNGMDSNMEEAPSYSSSNPDLQQAKSPQKPGPKREPVPEAEPEDEETASLRKAKEAAEAEKKLGTDNYKKRQFDAAIEHYSKAWDLHKDITYLTNISAAKFEKGDFEGAIQDCKKAIEEGRVVLVDFKIIAK